MALLPGMCSVTFRKLAPEAVLELAVAAGLSGVEWGGDVHAPPGDEDGAAALARRCADAGLRCPSYGSYLFASQATDPDVAAACDTALALGASTVRIWCPFGTGPDSPAPERSRVAEAVAELAAAVAARGLAPALEFHPGTLTETAASTLALLDLVGVDGLTTYWQPAPGAEAGDARAEYDRVRSRVSNLHVFWWRPGSERRPLAEGADLWPGVLDDAAERPGPDRWAHLEFVSGDSERQFAADASTLTTWTGKKLQQN